MLLVDLVDLVDLVEVLQLLDCVPQLWFFQQAWPFVASQAERGGFLASTLLCMAKDRITSSTCSSESRRLKEIKA